MSYYYTYYAGYKKNGKIYIMVPYDDKGNLHALLVRSRSFASDLHHQFCKINEDEITDSLRDQFSESDYKGEIQVPVKILPFDDLPSGDFLRSGYVPISQVEEYETDGKQYADFYDILSPTVYAAKVNNQIKFMKKPDTINEFGEIERDFDAADYMFYVWADRDCPEYEAFIIRSGMDSFVDDLDKESKPVIILYEG